MVSMGGGSGFATAYTKTPPFRRRCRNEFLAETDVSPASARAEKTREYRPDSGDPGGLAHAGLRAAVLVEQLGELFRA